MKRNILLIVLAVLMLLLAACGAKAEEDCEVCDPVPAEELTGVTFYVTDDLDRAVEVPVNPQRVAALIGSFADIWSLAGDASAIVAAADDTWTSFDIDLPGDTVNLGAVKEISLESLIAAEPELILASTNTEIDLELRETFEELGIPTLYFHVDSFQEYLHMLEICTQITGRTDNYVRYGLGVRQQVEGAIARQDGSEPSVLYIRATGSSCKAKGSEGNVLGEMLAALGCRNIADSDESLLDDLSLEAIIAADPAYIFIVYQGSDPTDAQALLEETLLSNPAWATLTAVEEGRVFVMEHKLYNLKPNDQWGEAYEHLADILYGGAATTE